MADKQASRLSQLDAVRGIAALMVVLFHYTLGYSSFLEADYHASYGFFWGKLGVHFFFMVSGFVIFMTLCRTATGADFIVSRFSRLYPAYWLAVLLTAFIVNAMGPADAARTAGEIAVNLTMLQEFLHVRHVDGVYWTLTCELIFYAWMFLFFKCRLLGKVHVVLTVWLAFAFAAWMYATYVGEFPPRLTRYLLLEYAHLFAGGILFYEIYSRRANGATYALLGLCLADAALAHGAGTEFLYVCGFFVVFLLIALGKARYLDLTLLSFLGTISYSLYLLHENLGYLVLRFLHEQRLNADLAIGITVMLAIGLATLATYLIERPAMNLIRGIYKRHFKTFPVSVAGGTGLIHDKQI